MRDRGCVEMQEVRTWAAGQVELAVDVQCCGISVLDRRAAWIDTESNTVQMSSDREENRPKLGKRPRMQTKHHIPLTCGMAYVSIAIHMSSLNRRELRIPSNQRTES